MGIARAGKAELRSAHPAILWDKVKAVGNIQRHEYDDVYPEVIWNITTEHLAPLRRAVVAMIEAVDEAEKSSGARQIQWRRTAAVVVSGKRQMRRPRIAGVIGVQLIRI